MGWQPEGCAFRCPVSLLGLLIAAAVDMGRCCRAAELWLHMIRRLYGAELDLRKLLSEKPELLPDWVLCSFELADALIADASNRLHLLPARADPATDSK